VIDTAASTQQTDKACRESTLAAYQNAVLRVIEAMKGRLDEPFTLKSMAKVAYSSPYHFNRTFRRITGIPPCQYLWALRLEAATRRLRATDDPVLSVCYDVGYSSLGTFTRRFTELFGIPPARFRALVRSSKGEADLEEVLQQNAHDDTDAGNGQFDGRIEYPADFSGPSAIGLFTESIPQGRPVACCFSTASGPFQITRVPDGRYYLFALGVPDGSSLCDTQNMYRGGGNRIIFKNGNATGKTLVKLRPPETTDPPILLALPVLLQRLKGQLGENGRQDLQLHSNGH
jgi:AraC family transcriptional regulator